VETAVELDLPVDHTSAREARRFIANAAGLAAERLADAQLVASELVTNALLHAGLAPTDRILLALSCHGSRLRIDVQDAGTFTADSETFFHGSRNGDDHGRGLRVVQALTTHWQADTGRVSAWLNV
jgi:anti-sigma regulatory factor (Ser/Thr protein kinase)